jgi:hypothetical protein
MQSYVDNAMKIGLRLGLDQNKSGRNPKGNLVNVNSDDESPKQ